MTTPAMAPMMMIPIEPLVSAVNAPLVDAPVSMSDGAGGGGMVAMVGGVTTASTTIETPVTLASMAVALLGLLVALAIVDCTEAAVDVVVWMLTPTTTLADIMVNSTADGSTLAWVAIAFFISVRTFGVNEEMSPSSKSDSATTLIAGGEGGGGEGEGGGGESGGGEGGEGEGGDGGSEGGGGDSSGGEGKGCSGHSARIEL